MAFTGRSNKNPSANGKIILHKCSFQSDKQQRRNFMCQGATIGLFAQLSLDAFFSIIQSEWSNSVTVDDLWEIFNKQYKKVVQTVKHI